MSQGTKQNAIDLAAHKLYKATKNKNLVAPQTYGNASMKEVYVLPAWFVRAGAGELSKNGRGV